MRTKILLCLFLLFFSNTIYTQSINQKDSLGRKIGLWIDTVKINSNSTSDVQIKYYKVKKGDTLARIASQFGVSIKQLKEWNDLKYGTKISVDMILKISNNDEFATVENTDEYIIAEYRFTGGLPNGSCTIRNIYRKKLQEGQMKDGVKVGLWKIYGENEVLEREGYFENNEKNGKWIFYHPNGNKHKECNYVDGLADGICTIYFASGKKEAEGKFKYDEQEGKWTIWYENGKKQAEGNFIAGMKEGFWIYFYENGKKMAEGKHERNNRIGKWKEWDEKGKLTTNTYWEW